jgi:hypothetical protein
MSETIPSKRGTLVRNSVIFQLKLMVDGFRDLVLLPVSLVATIIGLLRGGDEPEREFNQIIEVGRESERWINLFGNHSDEDNSNAIVSIDSLFTKVEETLKQQYKTGGISERVQAEIEKALKIAQEKAKQKQLGQKNGGVDAQTRD